MKKTLITLLSISGIYLNQANAETAPVVNEVESLKNKKEALAKQVSNPIASLISLPIQINYDQNIGADDKGSRTTINIQPVAPFELSKDWNVISRTILPLISQSDVSALGESESGIGDIVQSVFFSPKAATDSGWIWGAGPVLLLPSGTDKRLTADKWGIGPTAVALKQTGPWTYGGLVNHIVSVAGDDNRGDINASFIQPFLSYTTPSAVSYTLNTEATYDWEAKEWTVPIYAGISKVVKIDKQMISFSAGIRYWAATTNNSPEGLAFRLQAIFLFPK
jgi:hypothetical protein